MQKEFKLFVEELKKERFNVTVDFDENLEKNFVRFSKNGAMGFAGEKHNPKSIHAHEKLNGMVVLENEGCFDKLRKCPIQLPLPKNKNQVKEIIDEMIFLGSKEGYKMSSENEYPYIDTYEKLEDRK